MKILRTARPGANFTGSYEKRVNLLPKSTQKARRA